MDEGKNILREKILRRFVRIAFFDIRDLFDINGRLIPLHELDEDTASAIAEYNISIIGSHKNRKVITSIKLVNKVHALNYLAKCLGMSQRSWDVQFSQNKDIN